FQIFSNKCVDLIRKVTNNKQRVHQSVGTPELLTHLPDTARAVIEKLIVQEEIEKMKQFFGRIGEKCKEILLLFEDGYTDEEIAQRLSYSNAAVVKTTRTRCREKLKNLFAEHDK
ncbi:MAG: sigma-70 family RNA polymerase sigma factor, partial [Chitinophagaceae bacterium]|nr:sigma-70 family RNA polymerase sigma factor [Chitinophagaceae bacterium]